MAHEYILGLSAYYHDSAACLLRDGAIVAATLARLISKVSTPIFMRIVYFVAITPIGFIRGFGGGSPILRRDRPASRWEPQTPAVADPERMERQF